MLSLDQLRGMRVLGGLNSTIEQFETQLDATNNYNCADEQSFHIDSPFAESRRRNPLTGD